MIDPEDLKKIRLSNRKQPKKKRAWWKNSKKGFMNGVRVIPVKGTDDVETQSRRDLEYHLHLNTYIRERPDNSTRMKDGIGRWLT